jgi:hypothetical protein
MMSNEERMQIYDTIDKKERILSELIVWLKTKGLWEEAKSILSINIVDDKTPQPVTHIDDSGGIH